MESFDSGKICIEERFFPSLEKNEQKKLFAEEFAKMILCIDENNKPCNKCKSCIEFENQVVCKACIEKLQLKVQESETI